MAVAALVLWAAGGQDGGDPAPRPGEPGGLLVPEPPFERVPGIVSTGQAGLFEETGLESWREEVPEAQEVRISSSRDRTRQRALWLPPSGAGPRPLLLVLHSWTAGFENRAGIPFAQWARSRGWAFVQPDFRGPFDDPRAAGSDLAVRDVLDAIDYAGRHPGVDRRRVFAIGFSGGGMMSLLMAGRHPERFRAVASWVPVYDLTDFHEYNETVNPGRHYAGEVEAACGGDPFEDAAAAAECERRSPRAHLAGARAAGLPVYIGHGLGDTVVPPDQALRAFNRLAPPGREIAPDVLRAARANTLPDGQRGAAGVETFFRAPDPPVAFARQAGAARVVLFDGDHDMVYHPALEWMTGLASLPG